LGPLPPTVIPARYRLALTIDPRAARFRGHDEISVAITKPAKTLYLHGLDLNVTRVFARLPDGATVKATYRQVDPSGVVRLDFARRLPIGKATLVFDYNAPFNPSLAGLYRVRHGGLDYAFTQFEATDARRMFPSFDEPGFKTPFDVIVNAPKADVVVANTPMASKNATGGGMIHWVFRRTAPLPTYLLALAVGPFDVVDGGTIPADKYRKRPIALRGVTAKGQGEQMRYALSLTPKVVMALEHYFHIGYPFRKLDMIAVPDFSAGAMENAGAITFRERYLLMGPKAPLGQRLASLDVQAHEITHQWFGDLVTPKWWDDIWLNESFANWMEAKAAAAVMPKGEFGRETLRGGLDVMDSDELASARRIHNPVRGPDDVVNIFDGITYDKGAAVLFMFEHYVGEAAWQKGIHAYLLKYAHRNATAREFIQTIARVTHHPEIVAAFDSYINQAGVPDLSVALKCNGMTSLSVTQAMYAQIGRTVPHRQWSVPMCVSGPDMKGQCRIVRDKAKLMLGGTCPAYVMPNAQGRGYYRFTYDAEGWSALIKAAPAMSPADQLTLFANLDAALHADRATPADLLAFVRAVAPNAQWDLIGAIADMFHGWRDHLLAAKDIPAYERLLRGTFAPRLRAIGLDTKPGEEPAVTLVRVVLVQLLVEEAHDPQTLAALTKAADAYLASGGKRLDGISPDLVQEAMRAAVIEKGRAFGRKVMEAYKTSKDDYFHRAALYAIAGADDAKLLDSVFGMALTPQIHIGDIRYFYSYMGAEPAARAALWHWLQAHYDVLLKRVTAEEMPRAAGLFTHACDAHLRDEAEAFFRPKEKTVPGLKRRLDLARERIDRCIAFKDAETKAVRAALLETVK
jgi:alanyl aminopeptidase